MEIESKLGDEEPTKTTVFVDGKGSEPGNVVVTDKNEEVEA